MIQEEYVSFDTAKMLKEAGFECNGEYYYDKHGNVEPGLYAEDDDYPRPTQSLAARWIREVHKLHIFCMQSNHPYSDPSVDEWEWCYIVTRINQPNVYLACEMEFITYEQAMDAGIQKALEIIKERNYKYEKV